MKKTISVMLAVFMLLSAVYPSAAAAKPGVKYYVDAENGNDENDGTSKKTAWKTASKAHGLTLSEGDELLFKCGGEYPGSFLFYANGTKENPVKISSYGKGEKPVLHGADENFVLVAVNPEFLTVENLACTNPAGFGFGFIAIEGKLCRDITLRDCEFNDIGYGNDSTNAAAVYIDSAADGAKFDGFHIDGIYINHTSWGIHTNGWNIESDKEHYISDGECHNRNYLFENLYVEDALWGGLVISAVNDMTVRNCRFIDCATTQDGACAPVWTRHSNRVTIEYCEVCGSTNRQDGMTIDFDGWTVDSTYRYIYSHDNNRFIKNCVYDNKTHNHGCKVEHCVSVGDNTKMNWAAICLFSTSLPSLGKMHELTVDDVWFVDAKPVFRFCTAKSVLKNIKFGGAGTSSFVQRLFNLFHKEENFEYSAPTDEEINARIAEITKNLPQKP